MKNIRDWCISRQIWWGHRIPVYYCKRCAATDSSFVVRRSSFVKETKNEKRKTKNEKHGIIVSKTKPEKCPECGSAEIEQDPDVLDTWFSSWLWPFSTFGWPKKTPELEYFYPTDSLVTAQEIIFFWVARMIMAGMEFMKKIPFKDVYIHGTVRDITGTKMSKSLGNIIDPLDMIAKYGADALRFSLVSITAQGQDVFLSETKFELGRNFANKVWNASRFILMNLDRERCGADLCVFFKGQRLSLPERWILSRFYSTLVAVERSIASYRFNEAANAVYEFFWHEFCDWYIETAKSSLAERRTQVILYKVLEKSLRMLHPFMPFVTEEIWRRFPHEADHEGDSIMVQPWPHMQKEMISKDAEERMRSLINVITAIRNMRSVWNIEPQVAVKVTVNVHDKRGEDLLLENADMIRRLARAADLEIGKFPKPENSAASVIGKMEAYVALEGVIDLEKEKARLEKEAGLLKSEEDAIKARLRDRNFLSKAPKDVVARQLARKDEIAEQIKRFKDNLKNLK
jgi:valyl-tRNA synthetase